MSMYDLRHKINLLHYNIWRFERCTRRLVFGNNKITSIEEEMIDHPGGKKLDDLSPFVVYTAEEQNLPNYSGKHFAILVMLLFITAINLSCALLSLDFKVFWFWGMILAIIPALLISNFLTQIPWRFIDGVPTRKNQLLADFKIFESMPTSYKRRSGLITFLIILAIWTITILSFIYCLRSSIALHK